MNNISKQSDESIRSLLADSKAEVRFAAAVVVGDKKLPFGSELIELFNDTDHLVVQAARRSLVVLSYHVDAAKKAKVKGFTPKAVDYGPALGSGKAAKSASSRNWRSFITKNEKILNSLQTAADTPSKSGKN